MKKPISSKDIEAVTNNHGKNKSPGPERFIGDSYQTFKDLLNLIHIFKRNTKQIGILPNNFFETNITQIL